MKTNYVKTGLYSRYINLGFFVLMAALLLSSLVTGCKQKAVDNTPAAKIITIDGDERIALHENASIEIPPNQNLTWGQIESQAMQKVFLMSVWDTDDYGIYEWRLDNENGEKLTAGYLINKSITVYAVTNYNKFNIVDNKIKLTDGKGYTGSEPKGKIIIPDGITEIEDNTTWNEGAFNKCNEIISVSFPASLTKIGSYAFYECKGLTSLDLSGCTNITEIGRYAFYECKGLTSLDLSGCTNLIKINNHAFSSCTGLTSLDLSGCTNITEIGRYAFYKCKGLTSLDLSGCTNLIEINDCAFSWCTVLTSVDISRCTNLTEIGDNAFSWCKGLKSVNLSECTKLTTIKNFAFNGCIGLESVNLSGCTNLTEIGTSAFYECAGLTDIDLSGNIKLTKIELGAFGCINAKVKLPESITTIQESAFGFPGSSSEPASFCKKVLIKSGPNFDRIKQLVIDSGYPEDRIGSY